MVSVPLRRLDWFCAQFGQGLPTLQTVVSLSLISMTNSPVKECGRTRAGNTADRIGFNSMNVCFLSIHRSRSIFQQLGCSGRKSIIVDQWSVRGEIQLPLRPFGLMIKFPTTLNMRRTACRVRQLRIVLAKQTSHVSNTCHFRRTFKP